MAFLYFSSVDLPAVYCMGTALTSAAKPFAVPDAGADSMNGRRGFPHSPAIGFETTFEERYE